ncbi:unnamed protein product [Blepharisma stoltei]|uniref:Uncharacterized protein n=1 Tax=Blepharisma stoltei TaxID=1481888 RepID=A0AAU9J742_9CILI|nr:unnamed protein product [Blepharisma stoltei]
MIFKLFIYFNLNIYSNWIAVLVSYSIIWKIKLKATGDNRMLSWWGNWTLRIMRTGVNIELKIKFSIRRWASVVQPLSFKMEEIEMPIFLLMLE